MDVPNESQSHNNTKDPQVSVLLEGGKNPIQYQISEHLIAFWVKGNETKWHLGVVEHGFCSPPSPHPLLHHNGGDIISKFAKILWGQNFSFNL